MSPAGCGWDQKLPISIVMKPLKTSLISGGAGCSTQDLSGWHLLVSSHSGFVVGKILTYLWAFLGHQMELLWPCSSCWGVPIFSNFSQLLSPVFGWDFSGLIMPWGWRSDLPTRSTSLCARRVSECSAAKENRINYKSCVCGLKIKLWSWVLFWCMILWYELCLCRANVWILIKNWHYASL